jgi:hypothetical protein
MPNKHDIRMDDDELLQETIAHLRSERRRRAHEERLDAFVEGTLDEKSVRALAPLAGDDLDDEIEAFTPLSAEARGEISQRLLAKIASERGANSLANGVKSDTALGKASPVSAASHSRASERQASEPRAVVITLRRLTVAVSALALAASLAFVLRGRTEAEAPLPKYEVAFVGGEQAWRGEAPNDPARSGETGDKASQGGKHRFSHGERVRLSVRPGTTVSGPIEARIFLRRGEDVRPWPTSVDVSSAGAIRIAASPDTLPAGTEGEWELVVAIGRPQSLPGPSDLESPKAGVQLVSTPVVLAP